jgi:hypothetical protein
MDVLEVNPAQWRYHKSLLEDERPFNGRGNSDRDNVAQSIVN